MSTHSTFDPKSFQKLLASAQASGITTASLSATIELQRLFATGRLDADGTMRVIAEGALRVAHASGVAIGVLQGDHLVCRAGSGSAATSVGRHVMAALTASAHNQASGELLRVENAQTDPRIEAAICRQFGANSLLILPIYQDRTLAGVLQVLFSEAHVFQTREVRTYQLMAGLVGETMSHAAQLEHNEAVAAKRSITRQGPEQRRPQTRDSLDDGVSGARVANKAAVCQTCGASIAQAGEFPSRQQARAASTIMQRAKHVVLYERRWGTGMAAAVAALLAIASWIAQSDRRSTTTFGASALESSKVIEHQVSSAGSPSKPLAPPVPQAETRKAAGTGPHWVRVGNNELDYVAQDVTVRYFTPRPRAKQVGGGERLVYIGEDVTVRYFTPKQTVAPPQLVYR